VGGNGLTLEGSVSNAGNECHLLLAAVKRCGMVGCSDWHCLLCLAVGGCSLQLSAYYWLWCAAGRLASARVHNLL
jgi:hypothetical protein